MLNRIAWLALEIFVWDLGCGWRSLLQVDHHPEHPELIRQTHNTTRHLSPPWPSWPHVRPHRNPVPGFMACCRAGPSLFFSPPVLSESLMVFSELTAALSVTGRLRRGKITPNVRAFVGYGESSGICLLCRSKTSKFLNTDSFARSRVKLWALPGMLLLI